MAFENYKRRKLSAVGVQQGFVHDESHTLHEEIHGVEIYHVLDSASCGCNADHGVGLALMRYDEDGTPHEVGTLHFSGAHAAFLTQILGVAAGQSLTSGAEDFEPEPINGGD
jgi:hypothetical protein